MGIGTYLNSSDYIQDSFTGLRALHIYIFFTLALFLFDSEALLSLIIYWISSFKVALRISLPSIIH